MTPIRLSPIHSLLPAPGSWREINGMPTLVHLPSARPSDRWSETVGLADFSCLMRVGVKGAGAADWLRQQGIEVSDRPNTWLPLPQGGRVARLGLTEFLLEDGLHSEIVAQLNQVLQADEERLPARVYPVGRQDLAIGLGGQLVDEVLRQTCAINFRALNLSDRPVVLTAMIGVTVIVIPDARDGLPFYRIWCDRTFGVYFWQTLRAIVQELGGRVIGLEQILGIESESEKPIDELKCEP
jgi:sarcosine oxidase, subunit gamma